MPSPDLLSHEFTHSWNGKYRRPFNLYQTDFEKVQQGSLLWVYEGMTEYLGNVLAARSGLKTQAQYRDVLALNAADMDSTVGREWRPTEDTAVATSILRDGNPTWSNWKRGQDYYFEGELFWLDADTLIRKNTNNAKSLNDFEKIFLGKGGNTGAPGQLAGRGENTGPLIVPYTREELVADLNQVMPYDWAPSCINASTQINPRADVAGLERGGYKLVYTDKPSAGEKTISENGRRPGRLNVWFSLGLVISAEGVISDVRWNSPADKARLAPGMKLVGVNGNIYSNDALKEADEQSKGATDPIHLITSPTPSSAPPTSTTTTACATRISSASRHPRLSRRHHQAPSPHPRSSRKRRPTTTRATSPPVQRSPALLWQLSERHGIGLSPSLPLFLRLGPLPSRRNGSRSNNPSPPSTSQR